MPSTGANLLLSALSSQEHARITDRCEPVVLSQGQVMAKPGGPIREVYFPVDSFFVRLARVAPTGTIGVGLIGSEGMLGASLALEIGLSPLHASVAGGGTALRMSSTDFKRSLRDSPLLERQVQLYLYLQLRQAHQTTPCTVFHVVEKRLAYWLLMLHDRVHADRIHLTQARLARLLGVRRSGVSTAAGLLRRRGLINYSRGHIVILSRKELEKAACSCYRKGYTTTRQIVAAHEGADVTGSEG